jgi:hypothetical protein
MLRSYKKRPNFWGGLRSIHSPLVSVCPLGNIAKQQDYHLFKSVAAARVWSNVARSSAALRQHQRR